MMNYNSGKEQLDVALISILLFSLSPPKKQKTTGTLITPQERIFALQQLAFWEERLEERAEEVRRDKAWKKETGWVPSETAHAPETRLSMAREMAEQKAEKEANEARRQGTEKKPPREIPGVFNARGEIR